MNKDVIYIDVEDDVTAIIGKIKASKEKIIALVPPKRVGILQSAVNLRLLDRMATTDHKHLVLITNNQALIALSAAAGIPVAKNLQSKPELAEISALNVDDEDDVIDGSSLPIGELEKTTDRPGGKNDEVDDAIETLDIDDKKVDVASGMGAVAIKEPKRPKSGVKVPNFNSFRKKLFLGIAAFIILVLFLVWANVFAPAATVIITAKTVATPISQTVSLGTTPTDVSKGTVQAVTQTLKKDVSVKFTPTGSQDLGAKATGTVTIKNCDSNTSFTIDANTTFTASSGQEFVNPSTVTVPGYTGSASNCIAHGTGAGVATVGITASAAGPSYNIAATTYSIDGISSSAFIYANGTATSGGTTNIQTVVSASDVATATTALNALSTTDDEKALTAQYKNGEFVMNDTFNAARGAPVSSPAVGAQASGQATLTSSVTYTISALAQPDVKLFLDNSLTQQLKGSTDQRVYDDGISKVVLAGYSNVTGTGTINIASTAQVGPNIDTDSLKAQVKGKKSGEVQALLANISGISSVQVNFSYPWVTRIPNDTSKVDVQFKLNNG
jgi:hypothetical protein